MQGCVPIFPLSALRRIRRGEKKGDSLAEVCLYARKSKNTLLKLISQNEIYGTKPDNSGDYIIDRESIDGYYNRERDNIRVTLEQVRRTA